MRLPVTRRVLAFGALAVLVAALTFGYVGVHAASGGSNGSAKLANNVPSWATAAQLAGQPSSSSQIVISMYLQPNNQAALQQLIHDIYTPGNAQYHHYLTPAQFHAQFSPTSDQVSQVTSFLTSQGLKVEYTPADHLYVDASGTVAQVQKAFSITENLYHYQGMTLRANAQAPSIPSSLASIVTFIGGLDESALLTRPYIQSDPSAAPGFGYSTPAPWSTYFGDNVQDTSTSFNYNPYSTGPQIEPGIVPTPYGPTIPWNPKGYTPQQMRAGYGLSTDYSGLTGAGVRIAITDAFVSPTLMSDANRFSANHGLPALTSSNYEEISVPGTYNFPPNPALGSQGWYGEQSLDVEWVHAMAPGAHITYIGAQNSEVPLDHALINAIDNHLADIITNSWGIYGDTNYGMYHNDEFAFEQAAVEGISVLFSSGDDGDVMAQTGIAQGSWPATSPYVTAVGGTSLGVRNSSGSKVEYGWGTYRSTFHPAKGSTPASWGPFGFLYGSGGGVSLNFLQPPYQAGTVPSSLSTQTSTTSGTLTFSSPHRVTPDISMDADPNTGGLYGQSYNISHDALIDDGCQKLSTTLEYCERRIGGTSLASPLFAGMLALVNQQRFAANNGPIGFANPALYTLGSGSSAITDVLAPSSPTAVLRNLQGSGDSMVLTTRAINSKPDGQGGAVEGADTSLRTTTGWDDVTGLGTPNGSSFINALS